MNPTIREGADGVHGDARRPQSGRSLRTGGGRGTVGGSSYSVSMTAERETGPNLAAETPRKRKAGDRQDSTGRAYAGSQASLQVWVNRRQPQMSSAILKALVIPEDEARIEWASPLERIEKGRKKGFAEYRDGAFLRALGLGTHRPALKAFWPSGGPVWDGLAKIVRPGTGAVGYVLVEAKSYPAEVLGGGCKATKESRATITASLAAASRWLGEESHTWETRAESWMGEFYQSANRIAHVYFLRERLGLEAYMVNVCFTGDPRTPTTEAQWVAAKGEFSKRLGIVGAATPWLVDIFLSAASHSEPVIPSEGGA